MAFSVFYRYEFTDFPGATGMTPYGWRVSFLRDNYTQSVVDLKAGAVPLEIEIDGQSDSRLSGFLSEKYNLELICTDIDQARLLTAQRDDEIQLLIEVDTTGGTSSYTTYRQGWVLPSELKQDYAPTPYPLKLSGICGLTRLKSRPFLDESGKRLQGNIALSHAIRLCLFQTGLSSYLMAGVNLYEQADLAVGQLVSGKADATRCPLYQTLINAEYFVSDAGSTKTAYDVLKSLLAPHLRLQQHTLGYWLLVRADEAGGGWDATNLTGDTTRFRYYIADNLSAGPTSSGSVGLRREVNFTGDLRPVEKGQTWKGVAKPGVRVEQSFGRYLSKLPNFDTVDGTGLPTGYRVNNLLDANRYRTGTGTDLDPYRLVIKDAYGPLFTNDAPYVAVKLAYGVNSREYLFFHKRTFKGRARLTNLAGAKMAFIAVRNDGPYILTGGDWKALTKCSRDDIYNAPVVSNNTYTDGFNHAKASAGYFDYSVELGTIDRVIELHVYFCAGVSLTHYYPDGSFGPETGQTSGIRPMIEYLPGQLVVQQQSQELDGQQRTIVRAGKIVTDTALSLPLGDVPDAAFPADRIGTMLSRGISSSPINAARWFRPDADILATNPTGKDVGKRLLDWCAETESAQNLPGSDLVDVTLLGRLPYGAQTALQFFDIGETVISTFYPHTYQLTRYRYTVRDCTVQITGERIMPTLDLSTGYTSLGEWQTPNGNVPQSLDEQGLPAPIPGALTDKQKLIAELVNAGFQQGGIARPVTPPFGFVPLQPGGIHFGADLYSNGVKIGSVLASVSKLLSLRHHL